MRTTALVNYLEEHDPLKLYHGLREVDPASGKPADYEALFAAYRPLIMAAAERAKIPVPDREDAAQEVQLKFWAKNGLDLYDPEKNTKFATLYRAWASKFMLQERDKSFKNLRHPPIDTQDMLNSGAVSDRADESVIDNWTRDKYVADWIAEAQSKLEELGRTDLVRLLDVCLEAAESGKKPSREAVAAATGCKVTQATYRMKEFRKVLTNLGLGMESLYE